MANELTLAKQSYRTTLEEFAAVLACADQIDDRLHLCRPINHAAKVAAPIFTMLHLNCEALHELLPAPSGRVRWNLPACATLTRTVCETFVALHYSAFERITDDERAFRYSLIMYHYHHKRQAMFSRGKTLGEAAIAARRLEQARAELESLAIFNAQKEGVRDRQLKGLVSMTRDHESIAETAGIQREFWAVNYMWLSQFAHASPAGIQHFIAAHPGHPQAPKNMRLLATIGSGLLSIALIEFADLYPQTLVMLPEEAWKIVRDVAVTFRSTRYAEEPA